MPGAKLLLAVPAESVGAQHVAHLTNQASPDNIAKSVAQRQRMTVALLVKYSIILLTLEETKVGGIHDDVRTYLL